MRDSNPSQRSVQPPGMGALATALALLVLSLSVAIGHGRVICRGSDGHMALELGRDGACVAETSPVGEGQHGVELSSAQPGPPGTSCCGSCDDVALSPADPVLRKDAGASGGPVALSFAGASSGLPIVHLLVQRPVLAVREPRVSSTLASIRTISIRC